MRILILNGVNLNLTGTRSPEIYGGETLEDINREIAQFAESFGAQCDFLQTNFEGELVEALHAARGRYAGVVLNAGAWTTIPMPFAMRWRESMCRWWKPI